MRENSAFIIIKDKYNEKEISIYVGGKRHREYTNKETGKKEVYDKNPKLKRKFEKFAEELLELVDAYLD